MTVFSRPGPASRSRASTCTSSSGADTPPLSCSDGSFSEGSQSSIDLSRLDAMLANATHPVTAVVGARSRARARGSGHRRRIAQTCKSIYETIEEEKSNPSSPAPPVFTKKLEAIPVFDEVYVVDPAEPDSVDTIWDDEHGIITLRQYYALRDEAENTVTESRRVWEDTPFSLFALQCAYHLVLLRDCLLIWGV
jgi:serine/arginine repetitive matrix protein 2